MLNEFVEILWCVYGLEANNDAKNVYHQQNQLDLSFPVYCSVLFSYFVHFEGNCKS